jgi:hypothetical protein
MPATVELSVPPLRKQAGAPPCTCLATLSRSSWRNSVFNAAKSWVGDGRNVGVQ